jgi:hypothetical protein
LPADPPPGEALEEAPEESASAPLSTPPPSADESAQLDEPLVLDLRRRALVEELSREAGWNLYESRRHFIATPVDDPWLIEGARLHLDATFAALQREFAPGASPRPRPKSLVRIYPSEQAYLAAGGPRGSTSFWSRADATLALFDAQSAAARATQTYAALQHVVVHEFLDSVLELEDVPAWLRLGLGGYFERLVLNEGGARAGRLEAPAAARRWDELREVTAAEGPPPLARLMRFDAEEFRGRNEFGSGAWRNLILCSSLVAYLLEAAGPGPSGSELLGAFVQALGQGDGAAQALERVLPGEQLESLDADWRRWVEARVGREF